MGYQQRSYKKFVATAATATLVASAIVPVASAANFSDVSEDNEFKTYIDSLSEQGIINGYDSDNTFRPNNNLTRGQVAIMLGRWLEKNGETVPTDWATNPRFSDVSPTNEELAKYAALVSDAEVFTGVGGKLNASQNISRQHMAVVLDRVAEQVAGASLVELAEEVEDKTVADLNEANADYRDEIQALVNLGISTVSNFRPTDEVTRAHFAKFLYTTIEIIEEVPTTPEVPTAEELQAEVASIVGTLPTVDAITTENAEAAKTTAATVATELTAVETAITEGEYTEEEVAALNKAIADAKAAAAAVVTKADEVIEAGKAPVVESVTAINATTISVTFSDGVTQQFTVDTLVSGSNTRTVSYKEKEYTVIVNYTLASINGNVYSALAVDDTEQITVIFKAPVNATEATKLANYTYDADRDAAGAVFNPTSVTLNTTAVGPFAAGQIATLTFPAGSIEDTDAAPQIKIGDTTINLTAANNPTVFSRVAAADADDASFGATLDLSAGTSAATAVTAGTSVTLTGSLGDTTSSPAGAQYRFQRPDGTFTDWTNLTLTDGIANEDPESFTATVNTTGFTPGAYTVQYRAVDVSGRVSAVTSSGEQLFISGSDVTAPATTAPAAGAAVFTLPTAATATLPAYSVRVTGVQAVDADSNVKAIQYRVEQFNAVTGAFTTVEDWTNATSQDGAFDEKTELANFTTKALTPGNSYRIQVRSVDVNNNASAATTITAGEAGAGVMLNTGAGTGITAAGADGNADGIFTVNTVSTTNPSATENEAVAPTLAAPHAAANAANNAADSRTLTVTGTADGDVTNRDGANTQTVAKVEYAVYQDTDNDGAYETTVTDFTTTGVTATGADGTFDDATETYRINYTLPTDGAFRVVTRVTNTAGNTALSGGLNTWVDTVKPTATITPNTATVAANDFVITFSEAVQAAGTGEADGATSSNANDADNYTLRLASGQILDTATSVVANGANSFIVTFADTTTPAVGTTVNVVNVEDLADADGVGGNVINLTSYTIQ